MKHKAIVGNIGQYDCEIYVAWWKHNAPEDNNKP